MIGSPIIFILGVGQIRHSDLEGPSSKKDPGFSRKSKLLHGTILLLKFFGNRYQV